MKLTAARRATKDKGGKIYVTMLHGLYRTMYMGERATHAERWLQARLNPSLYLSTISDGMAQVSLHILNPYLSYYSIVFVYLESLHASILCQFKDHQMSLWAASARSHQPWS